MLQNITREAQLVFLEEMIKKKVLLEKIIPVGLSYEAGKTFSIIELDEYNDDFRIILKYDGRFISEITYWNDEGKNTSICIELTEVETKIVPPGLKALLVKAFNTKKSFTYSANALEVANQLSNFD